MSPDHSDRVRLVQYSQVASLLGSCSVFFCEYFSSNLANYQLFQAVCIVLALLSWLCMRYTGLTASSQYESVKAETQAPTDVREVTGSIWSQTKQILTQRNFLAFVTINFCQIFHNTFISNFLRIFYEYLLGTDYLTGLERSVYYGLISVIPQVSIVFNTLRPRQNSHRFENATFKRILLNENVRISIRISLKFVPKGPINNIPALVQIMAWRCPGDKPLSEPVMVSLLTHICVTRSQWVNSLAPWS